MNRDFLAYVQGIGVGAMLGALFVDGRYADPMDVALAGLALFVIAYAVERTTGREE